MAKHFSAQASLRQMNVWGPEKFGLNRNRWDLYNHNGIHVNTDMDLSVRLKLLIYMYLKTNFVARYDYFIKTREFKGKT